MGFIITNQDLEANQELLSKVTLCHGDITAQELDAVFAPFPYRQKTTSLLSQAIFDQAGDDYARFVEHEMLEKKPGTAMLAPGGNLPCKYVISCVTPKWDGGYMGEDRALMRCFENGIVGAADKGCRRIGIPVFLTGNHGYPKPRAVRLAVKAIIETANAADFDEIRFVAFKEDVYTIFKERLERYGWGDNT